MIRHDETGAKRDDTWKYLTAKFPGDFQNVENYDPSLRIVLEYERRSHNREGQQVHPHGMSGCGIWFVGHPISHALFRPEDFKLVGIQSGFHKKFEYVKGTWIDVVLTVVWKYYPEVRTPMDVHGMRF